MISTHNDFFFFFWTTSFDRVLRQKKDPVSDLQPAAVYKDNTSFCFPFPVKTQRVPAATGLSPTTGAFCFLLIFISTSSSCDFEPAAATTAKEKKMDLAKGTLVEWTYRSPHFISDNVGLSGCRGARNTRTAAQLQLVQRSVR